jgi:hypothetical protein
MVQHCIRHSLQHARLAHRGGERPARVVPIPAGQGVTLRAGGLGQRGLDRCECRHRAAPRTELSLPDPVYWLKVRLMSNDTGPRLVSENSQAQIDKEPGATAVSWRAPRPGSQPAAHSPGAGKPEETIRQIDELVRVLVAYKDATGQWPPPHDLAAMLDIDRAKNWTAALRDAHLQRHYAAEQIIRGALQQAASRLLGQMPQATSGEHEMYEGIREIKRAHSEIRRERNAAHEPLQNLPSKRAKSAASKKPGATKP